MATEEEKEVLEVLDRMFEARRKLKPSLRDALARLDMASEKCTFMLQIAIGNLVNSVDRDLIRRGVEAVFGMDDVLNGRDEVPEMPTEQQPEASGHRSGRRCPTCGGVLPPAGDVQGGRNRTPVQAPN